MCAYIRVHVKRKTKAVEVSKQNFNSKTKQLAYILLPSKLRIYIVISVFTPNKILN